MNLNSEDYWDQRFSSEDWENKQGRWQTESFAKGQMEIIHIDQNFDGTILDFGCGLGDAIPVYNKKFPKAKLIGVDISGTAVEKCTKRFGNIATFIHGDHEVVPFVDIIIASNVFEHLDNDLMVAHCLLSKCRHLFITVPYRESPLCSEHVNTYDELYYSVLNPHNIVIFNCIGWTQYGFVGLWYNIYFKNLARLFLGKKLLRRAKQIMYMFENNSIISARN